MPFKEKVNNQRIIRVLLSPKGHSLMGNIEKKSNYIFIYNALEKMDETVLNNLLDGLKQLKMILSNE